MRTLIISAALVLSAVASRAATIGFDVLPAGSSANPSLANAYAAGQASFSYAVFAPDIDPSTGDPLPATSRWRADTTAGTPGVPVGNPLLFGRGTAPSGANALNVLDQPVLVTFGGLPLLSFGAILDRGSLTGNASPIQDILYLDERGSIVKSQPVDFSRSLNSFQASSLNGVSSVLLPAGKFYDDLTFVAVPEPSSLAIGTLAILGLAGIRRLPSGHR